MYGIPYKVCESDMLLSFLAASRRLFLSSPTPATCAVVVTVGNDAGDLDSIVSAIAYADWMTATLPEGGPSVVPTVPFVRADFALRRDAQLLFHHCGFTLDDKGAPASLLYLDDLERAAGAWRYGDSLGVALTDHNSISAAAAAILGERVVAIVDHHNDERRHLTDEASSMRRQAPEGDTVNEAAATALSRVPRLREIDPSAGSACSLLVDLMGPRVISSRAPELCVLLLGTIAIDTRGFHPDLIHQRYSLRDVRAAQCLYWALGSPVTATTHVSSDGFADSTAWHVGADQVDGVRGSAPALLQQNATAAEVAEAATLLRAAPLPLAARLRSRRTTLQGSADLGIARGAGTNVYDGGGADGPVPPSTIVELSAALLESRHNVSSFSTLELLRLDYKQATASGVTVGVAAIPITLEELIRRSGGATKLEQALELVAQCRGGLDWIFALLKADPASGDQKAVVAMQLKGVKTPVSQSTPGTSCLLHSLADVVAWLPEELRTQRLFESQQIASEGFGLHWRPLDDLEGTRACLGVANEPAAPREANEGFSSVARIGDGVIGRPSSLNMQGPRRRVGPGASFSMLRKVVTRKTLMPAIVIACERRPQPISSRTPEADPEQR